MFKGGKKSARRASTLENSINATPEERKTSTSQNGLDNTISISYERRTKPTSAKAPELVKRHAHHKSTSFQAGRTIGAKREHLETKRERVAAREKDKRRNFWRITSVSLGFIALIGILIFLAVSFFRHEPEPEPVAESEPTAVSYQPTIEIVDDSASATGGKITSRMRDYIGMLESDLKSYGYTPVKAVIPVDSIREVHFYLDGYPGYLKTTIDRAAGVTAEDIDRMLRYLQGQGINEFEYIDVRIDGRAFWK